MNKDTPQSNQYGQPDTQGDSLKALETLHAELHPQFSTYPSYCEDCGEKRPAEKAIRIYCNKHLKEANERFGRHKEAQMETQNKKGEWVKAIPLPYYLIVGVKCTCGCRFLSEKRYVEHYAYKHIWKGE